MRIRAFTLIEFVIVVAIVAILSSAAYTSVKRLRAHATQSEARLNLGELHKLRISWEEVNGKEFNCNVYGTLGQCVISSGYGLSKNNLADPSDCVQPNFLGFAVSNCPKSRYSFSYNDGIGLDIMALLGSPGNFRGFYAHERNTIDVLQPFAWQVQNRKVFACCDTPAAIPILVSADLWAMDVMGELSHINDPLPNCL